MNILYKFLDNKYFLKLSFRVKSCCIKSHDDDAKKEFFEYDTIMTIGSQPPLLTQAIQSNIGSIHNTEMELAWFLRPHNSCRTRDLLSDSFSLFRSNVFSFRDANNSEKLEYHLHELTNHYSFQRGSINLRFTQSPLFWHYPKYNVISHWKNMPQTQVPGNIFSMS